MSREKHIDEKAIEEMAKVLKYYTKKNNIMASHVILDDFAEALYTAGYRKQSENTIELPCKVGDRLWYIDRYSGKFEEDLVKFFTITKKRYSSDIDTSQ